MRLRSLLGCLVLLPVSAAGQSTQIELLSFSSALEVFDELCVRPLPSVEKFTETLNASQWGWQPATVKEGGRLDSPNYFQSQVGHLSYVTADHLPKFIGSPSCHFEFLPDADYHHADAARALSERLSLGTGKEEGVGKRPQTKWEAKRPDGMTIRVFLSSGVDKAGRARLSISRLREHD